MTTISVIIPTHNRGASLKRTLESALLLEYPRDQFEIVVVDNASTDHTESLVRDMQARHSGSPELHYVAEARLGLHYARHAGFHRSKGELLLFTDDDATFSAGWLHAYADAFDTMPDMEAAGGPVRGRVFDWTGFHPELLGTRTIGDGESGLLSDIVHKLDWKIGYVPGALVYHHIPPHRMTIAYLRKWAWHLGGALMFQKWWRQRRSFSKMVKELYTVTREHGKDWLKAPWVRQRTNWEAIQVMFQASLGWAKLSYLWWMLRDPQVKAALDTESFRP